MKKVMIAAAAALMVMSASAADVYVGAERAMKSGENTAYVGATQSFGTLAVTAQLDTSLNSGDRGTVKNVNLDASMALSNRVSVYLENDLTRGLKLTESKVGVKFTF